MAFLASQKNRKGDTAPPLAMYGPGYSPALAKFIGTPHSALPDLGSEQKNHKLDTLLSEFAEKVARLIEDT